MVRVCSVLGLCVLMGGCILSFSFHSLMPCPYSNPPPTSNRRLLPIWRKPPHPRPFTTLKSPDLLRTRCPSSNTVQESTPYLVVGECGCLFGALEVGFSFGSGVLYIYVWILIAVFCRVAESTSWWGKLGGEAMVGSLSFFRVRVNLLTILSSPHLGAFSGPKQNTHMAKQRA
jgi:hypothetical protein